MLQTQMMSTCTKKFPLVEDLHTNFQNIGAVGQNLLWKNSTRSWPTLPTQEATQCLRMPSLLEVHPLPMSLPDGRKILMIFVSRVATLIYHPISSKCHHFPIIPS